MGVGDGEADRDLCGWQTPVKKEGGVALSIDRTLEPVLLVFFAGD